MLFRSGFKFFALAASGLLVAGCHSALRQDKAAGESAQLAGENTHPVLGLDGEELPLSRSKSEASSEDRDRIDAHAHYAMAVIRELNGESDQSLGDYFDAALKDLNDEGLVLDVSRRLLLSKQPEKALELVNRAAAS